MPDPIKERISLRSVLDKIEKAADEQYDGRIYENILAIFKELEVAEQRVFLRGLINICLTFKKDISVERQPGSPAPVVEQESTPLPPVPQTFPIPMPSVPPNPSAMHTPAIPTSFPTDLDDAGTLEDYNARELIRLKSWVVKKLVASVFWVIVAILGYVAFFGNKDSLMKTAEYVMEMIKTAVGL